MTDYQAPSAIRPVPYHAPCITRPHRPESGRCLPPREGREGYRSVANEYKKALLSSS